MITQWLAPSSTARPAGSSATQRGLAAPQTTTCHTQRRSVEKKVLQETPWDQWLVASTPRATASEGTEERTFKDAAQVAKPIAPSGGGKLIRPGPTRSSSETVEAWLANVAEWNEQRPVQVGANVTLLNRGYSFEVIGQRGRVTSLVGTSEVPSVSVKLHSGQCETWPMHRVQAATPTPRASVPVSLTDRVVELTAGCSSMEVRALGERLLQMARRMELEERCSSLASGESGDCCFFLEDVPESVRLMATRLKISEEQALEFTRATSVWEERKGRTVSFFYQPPRGRRSRLRGVVTDVVTTQRDEQVVLVKIDGRGTFRIWPEDRISELDVDPPPLVRPGREHDGSLEIYVEAVEMWNRAHPIELGDSVTVLDATAGAAGRVTRICDLTLYDEIPHVNVKMESETLVCPMHRLARIRTQG